MIETLSIILLSLSLGALLPRFQFLSRHRFGLLASLLIFMMTHSLLLTGLFFFLSFVLPAFFVHYKTQKRKQRILMALPYYLDLLVVSLEAGMDLVASLEEIIRFDRPHPLRDEMKYTVNLIRIGQTRTHAFETLAQRVKIPALGQWACAVRESEELGGSLKATLKLLSESLRSEIFQQAELQAERTPLKILIPLVLFIFPILFILLFFPIVIQFIK